MTAGKSSAAKKLKHNSGKAVGTSFQHHCWDDNENQQALNKENAYRSVAKLVCSADVPPKAFSSENECFRAFTEAINPDCYIPFYQIETHCLKIYEEEKLRVKQLLGSFDGQISLSLELLRSNGRHIDHYMCLKAHFIDQEWKLKTWVLDFFYVSYDKEPPETTLIRSLPELDILGKISSFTLADNEDNEEIVEITRNRVQEKKTWHSKHQFYHVHCCAYTFREMVEEAFGEMESLIRSVRNLLVCGKCPHPVWNVTLHTLKEAIALEAKGEYTEANGYFYLDLPSAEEWEKVRGACKLVGPVYDAAEVLFESKNPTAVLYLQNIQELRVNLTRECASKDDFVKATAQKMLEKLNEYWKDMFLVLAIATVLDPRCKMKYIEFSSMKYEGSLGKVQAGSVLEAVQKLYDDYAALSLAKDTHCTDSASGKSDSELPEEVEERRSSPRFGFNCLDEYNKYIQLWSQVNKSDLDLYLEEGVVPWSKEFQVLKWWKEASPKYPILSKIARDILAIPLTLANSADAYYTEQREPDSRLICLKPELAKALMCTRSWMEQPKEVV